MMTFFSIWLGMMVITAGTVVISCRGVDFTYRDVLIFLLVILLWPVGLPCMIWALLSVVVNGGILDKKAFTLPGGNKK